MFPRDRWLNLPFEQRTEYSVQRTRQIKYFHCKQLLICCVVNRYGRFHAFRRYLDSWPLVWQLLKFQSYACRENFERNLNPIKKIYSNMWGIRFRLRRSQSLKCSRFRTWHACLLTQIAKAFSELWMMTLDCVIAILFFWNKQRRKRIFSHECRISPFLWRRYVLYKSCEWKHEWKSCDAYHKRDEAMIAFVLFENVS